jgi:uncharacterized lipoprotein YbaY
MSSDYQPGPGPSTDAVVQGEVQFPEDTPAFSDGTIRVSLLDVTRADAPARTVAEQRIANVCHPGGPGEGVSFVLRVSGVNARARYEVRAHVDLDGDGRVSPGDYISTQSYPVLTSGHPDRLMVGVRRVGP